MNMSYDSSNLTTPDIKWQVIIINISQHKSNKLINF